MAYKGNWKNIKDLLSTSSASGSRGVTPILIHWNDFPVRAKPQTEGFFGASDHEFSYIVTLIKKRDKYQADLHFYILDFGKETPLITETKHFGRYQFKDLIDFITTPSKIFNLKKKHKNVRLYSQVRMTEKEFENEVELCRGKQT